MKRRDGVSDSRLVTSSTSFKRVRFAFSDVIDVIKRDRGSNRGEGARGSEAEERTESLRPFVASIRLTNGTN